MRFSLAVALSALCLFLSGPTEAQNPDAVFLSRYVWHDPARAFGGISGIDLAPDGRAFRAISDRGNLLSGRLRREDGQIIGVDDLRIVQLRNGFGTPLRGAMQDSEGLVWDGGPNVVISFEGNHRLAMFDADGLLRRQLPLAREFLSFESNQGMEALALGPEGALYTVAEAVAQDGKSTLYRFDGTRWTVAFRFAGDGEFLPVGADFGPDGALYLLERDFTGLGFRSRVRRFDLGDGTAQAGDGQVLWQSRAREFDNLEGVSVWRDGAGNLRLTMVSDDNFMRFQRTELVEFVISEGLAKSRSSD
ncbi:hypothetical protein A9Q95_15055 [Rhodobacterales bacterium 59_46_T64]|nr:hypothetical protein A9Q95_15055 [Rhodobacterales bacterium 59_46_T64]